MIRKWFGGLVFATAAVCAQGTWAQALERYHAPVLSPWFTSDGFLNKPGVDKARLTADISVCAAEAQRLKTLRATPTPMGTATVFTSEGRYDAGASGIATGVGDIIVALQDASYAGSIVDKEFRDCMTSLDYKRYTLDSREDAEATEDHGFAALVSAEKPAQGRPYRGAVFDNYYLADLVSKPFAGGTPEPVAPAASPAPASETAPPPAQDATLAPTTAAAPPDSTSSTPPEAPTAPPASAEAATPVAAPTTPAAKLPPQMGDDIRFDEPGDLQPVAPGALAVAQDGMAIVVISVRETAYTAADSAMRFSFKRVTDDGQFLDLLKDNVHFSALSFAHGWTIKDPTLKGDITQPRYSTFVIPAGRYVLRNADTLNACLGTLTFAVQSGDVVYLGDFVMRAAGLPIGAMLNPFGNIRTGMDKDMKASVRMAIGDDIDGARKAMQGEETAKASLKPAAYQNGYRIPCDGRYIGRVRNPAWSDYDPQQLVRFNDIMAAKLAEATETTAPPKAK